MFLPQPLACCIVGPPRLLKMAAPLKCQQRRGCVFADVRFIAAVITQVAQTLNHSPILCHRIQMSERKLVSLGHFSPLNLKLRALRRRPYVLLNLAIAISCPRTQTAVDCYDVAQVSSWPSLLIDKT